MTEYTYQVIQGTFDTKIIQRSDGACIPENPTNADYQAYLKWLENPNAEITTPTL